MGLQYILLLIGIIVVAIVAFSALDRARQLRRFHKDKAGQETVEDAPEAHPPRLEPSLYLDLNPAPPAETDKRFLPVADLEQSGTSGSSNEASGTPPAKPAENRFARELEGVEEVATMPLNLNPGLDRPAPDAFAPPQDIGRQSLPDEKIDFIIHLPPGRPVERDAALGLFKQNEYVLEKPRGLYGQRFRTSYWSNLQFDPEYTEYGDLMLAIQLIDGRGPIDETELHSFVQLGLKLADALHRPTKLPLSFEQALEHARRLQQLYDTYDVIAGVNIVSIESTGFNGREIEQAARQLGMQFGAMNIFHMKNDQSPGCRHLFSMANLYKPGAFDPDNWAGFSTRGLTLFMSVPCAHKPVSVFDNMVTTANGLCELLGGKLLDQEQRPLTEKGLALIRTQIEDIANALRANGIIPGSETALRLFRDSAVA